MRRKDFNKAVAIYYIKNTDQLYCKYNDEVNLLIDANQIITRNSLKNYIDVLYQHALKQEKRSLNTIAQLDHITLLNHMGYDSINKDSGDII